MWFWIIIYIIVGFIFLGIGIEAVKEENDNMTISGWTAAIVGSILWPIILPIAIGVAIAKE